MWLSINVEILLYDVAEFPVRANLKTAEVQDSENQQSSLIGDHLDNRHEIIHLNDGKREFAVVGINVELLPDKRTSVWTNIEQAYDRADQLVCVLGGCLT
jgi:hypothetical protein